MEEKNGEDKGGRSWVDGMRNERRQNRKDKGRDVGKTSKRNWKGKNLRKEGVSGGKEGEGNIRKDENSKYLHNRMYT